MYGCCEGRADRRTDSETARFKRQFRIHTCASTSSKPSRRSLALLPPDQWLLSEPHGPLRHAGATTPLDDRLRVVGLILRGEKELDRLAVLVAGDRGNGTDARLGAG